MKPQPPRTPSKLSDSVHHQLSMYALAASAAGVGVLALAQPAEAEIVYTPAHVGIRLGVHYKVDLNHDGTPDFVIYYGFMHDGIDAYLSVSPVNRQNEVWGTQPYASALPAGARIGPDNKRFQPWHSLMVVVSTLFSMGPWEKGAALGPRYLGLKFLIGREVHYGWARADVRGQPPHVIIATLTGYAYETVPKKPIIAGKTKGTDVITVRPASLGRLAAGASAIPAWRKAGGNK